MNTTRFAIGLVALLMIASAAAVVLSDSEQTDAVTYTHEGTGATVTILYDGTSYVITYNGDQDVNGMTVILNASSITSSIRGTFVGNTATVETEISSAGDIVFRQIVITSNSGSILQDSDYSSGIFIDTIVEISFAETERDPILVSSGYTYTLPQPNAAEQGDGFSGWQIGGTTYAPGQTVRITGATEITAVYGGEASVTGIEVVSNQEVYEVGDSPDVTVWAIWSDGERTDVTLEADISPETFTEDGQIVVSASYEGLEDTVTVTVNPEILPDTCTVTVSVVGSGYGTVQLNGVTVEGNVVFDVPYGTGISIEGNVLTVGDNTVMAMPDPDDDQYSYVANWGDAPGSVTTDTEITLTFIRSVNVYTVTWVNEDGTVLEIDTEVPYGTMPTYDGEIPTKESTVDTVYTHSGWTPEVTDVTGEATYTATYSDAPRTYTVTWVVDDVETAQTYEYGANPVYPEGTPTKDADAQYTYIFDGWDPEVEPVTGDATYTAEFLRTERTYTVTWVNDDGTVLETDVEVLYGTMPEYNGETPTKAADAQYTYTFSEWDPEVAAVTGNATYTAKYDFALNSYTVTWKVDGQDDILETYQYGETPVYPNGIPEKAEDAQYTYIFREWTPGIVDVVADATYRAEFDGTLKEYTVTFVSNGGSDVPSQTVSYGSNVEIPDNPTREGYVFAGWFTDEELTQAYAFDEPVTGDLTLYADWYVDAPNVTMDDMENGRATYSIRDNGDGTYDVTISAVPSFGYSATDINITPRDNYSTDNQNGNSFTIYGVTDDITVKVIFTVNPPVIDDDDEDYVPSGDITIQGGGDDGDSTVVVVAIAAGAVIALLAALVLVRRN